jgi:hypothetical protein
MERLMRRLNGSLSRSVRRSIQDVFQQSPLDLRFALQKTLDPRVTFTRASSATYVGSDGLIKTATTDEPRFDHNPTTGESLGLLVEEARTNLALQSNQFDTTWTNSNSSETAVSGTAPDGTNTAWEIKDTLDAISTAHSLIQSTSYTLGVAYTVSCWMKAGTLTEGGVVFPASAFTTAINCRINLATGAVIFSSAAVTASTVPYANGWYRVIATATATATSAGSINIRLANGGLSYTGTGTGTILIWAAQIEAGAFATSYTPTTGATVTRAADVASITGSNFSSWYNQTEGTVFSDCVSTHSASQVLVNIGATAANTGASSIAVASNLDSSQKRVRVRDAASASQASLALGASSSGSRTRIAAAIKADDFAASLDGGAAVTDTTGTVPTVALMEIGSAPSGVNLGTQLHRRLTYWPTRLSNTTLQQITQP